MNSLSAAMNAAQRSLSAFSRSLDVVQNNIANAATPGYARQRVVLSPITLPGGSSTGVEVSRVQAMRDALLDYQALAARQQESGLETLNQFYNAVEPVFRLDAPGGIDVSLDGFFTAIADLSVNPQDANLRSAVLASADAVAGAFRSADSQIEAARSRVRSDAAATVQRVNALASEIADLQASRSPVDGALPAAAETRTYQALNELAGLIDFTVQRQNDGTLAVVAGSTPLVVGTFSRPLQVSYSSAGLTVFNSDGQDVTASLAGPQSRLGALLEAHNDTAPALSAEVNKLAKEFADAVNDQLAAGIDQSGRPGAPLFEYNSSSITGSGRTAGTTGNATPVPPSAVEVVFSGDVSGTIRAELDGFFVAAGPPQVPAAGDVVSVRFVSADGSIDRTISTVPLSGGETAGDIALRLNDQIALDPELQGLADFSVAGGNLKLTLSDAAGQGFTFESQTAGSGFTTGLESGGVVGGQSTAEIAEALNAEIAANDDLVDAGIRFRAVGGELVLDGDVAFEFAVTDDDPAGSGFQSGLDGATGAAGGAGAASSLRRADIGVSQIAAGTPDSPGGNDNLTALLTLAEAPAIGDFSFNGFYANLVSRVGGASANVASELQTQSQIALAAENLRDSFSGVDLNEEAIKLMQFEQGYSAMLRVIQVVDELNQQVLQLAG